MPLRSTIPPSIRHLPGDMVASDSEHIKCVLGAGDEGGRLDAILNRIAEDLVSRRQHS